MGVKNQIPQQSIFIQKLWSGYGMWSILVILNDCKIVLDPKSRFLTNFEQFRFQVQRILTHEK